MSNSDASTNEAGAATGGFVLLRSSRGKLSVDLRELWEYRTLAYFLTLRNIKARYKQTILGASWAIIQPFFTMVVFSLFFGRLAKLPSDDLPYPIFSYSALVVWAFFANAVGQSTNSLVAGANLIKRVYFPRLILPLTAVLAGLVDFTLAFAVLLAMMGFYGVAPTINIVALPFFLILAVGAAFGTGLLLSAVNVRFRDVHHAVPFLLQIWLFSTPIAYPTSLVPEPWRPIYALNPMVGVVDGFRWALLGTDSAPGLLLVVSGISAGLILACGFIYFHRTERSFADVV